MLTAIKKRNYGCHEGRYEKKTVRRAAGVLMRRVWKERKFQARSDRGKMRNKTLVKMEAVVSKRKGEARSASPGLVGREEGPSFMPCIPIKEKKANRLPDYVFILLHWESQKRNKNGSSCRAWGYEKDWRSMTREKGKERVLFGLQVYALNKTQRRGGGTDKTMRPVSKKDEEPD